MTTPREAFIHKLARGIQQRREKQLLRTLELPEGIDFTSNDYLGFCSDPSLRNALALGVKNHGTGSGASRLLRGNHAVHVEAEQKLAEFSGREGALLFSSGFATNVGLFAALTETGDVIFSDALNHASIIDGMRLSKAKRVIFEHQDLKDLEAKLSSSECSGQRFIVTESVFSMDGDVSNLTALVDLADRYNALVMVDEAHSTGLYGTRGSGIVERDGLENRVLCTMHTGGKALGVGGAWIAADSVLISHLINHSRSFIYSTAPVPALAQGLTAALEHLASHHDRIKALHERASFLRAQLQELGIDTLQSNSHIIPVFIGSNERSLQVAAAMREAGYDVRAVRPPTVPTGTARLRLTVRATMAESMLVEFANTLKTEMT
ncbi:MAG: 8-amino-7-oxononanoate synthase [Deltaproteobacteria bacterium]|nr:8-amino-7-oxononanoate synthase [Deltaproteobacteria bacterium]